MYLSQLFLEHFRCYSQAEFSFTPGVNIIIGPNGKGKTNILEAIYTLSTIKPFRNPKKEVFMRHGSEWARVRGTIQQEDQTEVLDLFWSLSGSWKSKRNDVPCTSARDYMQEKSFLAILFAPEDLLLHVLSPSHRRNFLSRLLSPLFPEYFSAMIEYERALKQRNTLLKQKREQHHVPREQFAFWDTMLIRNNTIIRKYHHDFFSFVSDSIAEDYAEISGKQEPVAIVPEYSVEDESFEDVLQQSFLEDVYRGSTSVGVHRDDFCLLLRGMALGEDSSRGETRSVILALKKAERAFIMYHTAKKPIILLDDVFSELDFSHKSHLLHSLKGHQCIITTTDVHGIDTESAHIISLE